MAVSVKTATTPHATTEVVRVGSQATVGRALVDKLRSQRGQMVTLDELREAIYGCRKDGGPGDHSIQRMIHTLRKKGIPIVRLSGYALF